MIKGVIKWRKDLFSGLQSGAYLWPQLSLIGGSTGLSSWGRWSF